MEYIPTIGLEIHVELKTKTKMFCSCLNDAYAKQLNVNVCPVCMAHPGTLPVPNRRAIEKVLIAGKALNGNFANHFRFDRKNYFYPDIPKGYQISQYKYPLVQGGSLNGINITRIHLEEDTGSSLHSNDFSLVDFNRAGIPLMELVTEPEIKSGEEAKRFGEELQLLLRYVDVSDANMEMGQMRVEANVSVSPINSQSDLPDSKAKIRNSKLGTKVEVKNLNSFRSVERAINYEIERQSKLLNNGETIKHETRGWDENKQKTFSQREKEQSHDYRYFPEPDICSFQFSNFNFQISSLELPNQKRERLIKEYGLKYEYVEILIRDKSFSDYFEKIISKFENKKDKRTKLIQLSANYLFTDLQSMMKMNNSFFGDLRISPENFTELMILVDEGIINSRVAKNVLLMMFESGGKPLSIIEEKNLKQTNNTDDIKNLVENVIQCNPIPVNDYKKGKESSLQFLIGQGMKLSKGSANPDLLKNAIKQRISEL